MFLVEVGKRAEAERLVDEIVTLRDEQGHALYYTWLIDLGWLLREFGRQDEFPTQGRDRVWHEIGAAILRDDLVGAAELLAACGMRTVEAYTRLRAAEELASQGRPVEAAEQRDLALAFYSSVGATAYVRRAEALLSASA
jgi:hypothetical protein